MLMEVRPFDPAFSILLDATSSLLSSPELSAVLPKILNLAELLLGADAYAVWRKRPEGPTWTILHAMGVSEEYRNQKIEGHLGPPRLNEPLIAGDVDDSALVAHRRDLYRKEGIKSLLVYPLATADGSIGTVAFYFRRHKEMDPALVQTGQLLTNIATAAISSAETHETQKKLRREAQLAAERAQFLADAGAVLGSSLNYSATLNRLAQLAVPKIADWCSVSVLDESRTRLERIAVAHPNPEKMAMAAEYNRKFPPDLRQPGGMGDVVRTGKSVLVPEITEELLRRSIPNEEQYRALMQLGMRSVLIVPLISRDVVLGGLTLVTADSQRVLGPEDLAMAESLAMRAAVAIDNARLYDAMDKAKADAQLRAAELRLVQEAAKVASWSFDTETQVFSFSGEAATSLLGLSSDAPSLTFEEFSSRLFFSTDQHRFREAFAMLEKGKKEVEIEIRVGSQRGDVHLLAIRGKLFFNLGESKVLGVLIDLTGGTRDAETRSRKKKESVRKSHHN